MLTNTVIGHHGLLAHAFHDLLTRGAQNGVGDGYWCTGFWVLQFLVKAGPVKALRCGARHLRLTVTRAQKRNEDGVSSRSALVQLSGRVEPTARVSPPVKMLLHSGNTRSGTSSARAES